MYEENPYENPADEVAADEIGGGTAEDGRELPTGRTPWDTLSARVISLVSRKGGVGKTTSAVNLGAALALSGHSVLVVGLDPQCGVCRTLGYGQDDLDGGLGEIFTGSRTLHHLAGSTPLPSLFFVSPNVWSLEAEEDLQRQLREQVDVFLQEIDRARNLYDTILIDCPPSFGAATRAALLASDSYLVPVQAEELCRDSLAQLLGFIETFTTEAYATSDLPVGTFSPLEREGLFLTMVSERTRMGKHVKARVTEDYAADLCETAVPRTTRLTEMALRGKPAVIYDRRSPGSRAYFNLADELIVRYLSRQARLDDEPVAAESGSAENTIGTLPVEDAGIAVRTGEGGPEADADSVEFSLGRLLRDLHIPEGDEEDRSETGSIDTSPADAAPEMISLDEVLAEEERLAGGRNVGDADPWDSDGDGAERFN